MAGKKVNLRMRSDEGGYLLVKKDGDAITIHQHFDVCIWLRRQIVVEIGRQVWPALSCI